MMSTISDLSDLPEICDVSTKGSPVKDLPYTCHYKFCSRKFGSISRLLIHVKYDHERCPVLSPQNDQSKRTSVREHQSYFQYLKSDKKLQMTPVVALRRSPEPERNEEKSKCLSSFCSDITFDPGECSLGKPCFRIRDLEGFRNLVCPLDNEKYECAPCEQKFNEKKIKIHMCLQHGIVVPLQVPLELLFNPAIILK